MRAAVFIFAFSAAWAAADSLRPGTITGRASFYGKEHRGRPMANGAPFDPEAMTAAGWDWPLGTRLLVTHGERSVVVLLTDRGPARKLRARGRVLDLSRAAFARLAPLSAGVIEVRVRAE